LFNEDAFNNDIHPTPQQKYVKISSLKTKGQR